MKNKLFLSFAFLILLFFTFNLNAQSDNTIDADSQELITNINSGSIENISSKSEMEGFSTSWNLNYEAFQDLKEKVILSQ